MGILLALTALFAWGLGDFLIQRSTRKFGDWIALFYITAFATIVLYPFVYKDVGAALAAHAALLWGTSVVVTIASIFNFEALRVGKISVIAPIFALEIPVAAILSLVVIGEALTRNQVLFIALIVLGIFLVSTRSFHLLKRIRIEKGVLLAVVGTIGMGATSFLFGLGSREVSPLMINWFTSTFITVVAFARITLGGQLPEVIDDLMHNKRLILNMSFLDNLAWVSFSYATLLIPIGVATGISGGFIAFAGALGVWFNKERLKPYQWIGFVFTLAALVSLSLVTDN